MGESLVVRLLGDRPNGRHAGGKLRSVIDDEHGSERVAFPVNQKDFVFGVSGHNELGGTHWNCLRSGILAFSVGGGRISERRGTSVGCLVG